ncbi:Clp protease N-terminal domain-containing protein [Niabella sp. W65]|nr:Clp protease N-terminal domain-containing protein [Niabella sp. W65]MCH7363991.1 Clp protease N-terminal domain-containing protein [Niabella sp. W65]ULT39877.1 Clp protease N-terminal domain-containing protein [Niabella sp. I65]
MKDDYVSLEHIIIGLMKVNDPVASLLKDSGLNEKI